MRDHKYLCCSDKHEINIKLCMMINVLCDDGIFFVMVGANVPEHKKT